jgi:hypothetical protein
MSTYEAFYDVNPIARIDQNQWTERDAELVLQFRTQPVIYTPLIDWDNTMAQTGAQTTLTTEMLEGDVDTDEIPFTANYINTVTTVDSRSRMLATKRYGDKVQMHESSNIFQQWRMSGGRDWRPLLRGLLGQNVIRKHEILARNAFLLSPQSFWTYAGGGTSFASLTSGSAHTFQIDIINEWNLRLGNTGTPVIPGDTASAKLCMLPPGVVYDFMKQLPNAEKNEASMWRDAQIYSGQALRYELGAHKGVRFIQVPNNKYGENMSILYNAGVISAQYGVTSPIKMGDGAPDPDDTSFKVDDVWMVGQKAQTHYIQLESTTDTSKFDLGDLVSIHVSKTATYGITDGVDFLSGKTIVRRIVKIDAGNHRLSFDRPVLFNYDAAFVGTPNTSGSAGTFYAYVTKAKHVGFCLVLGSRGGIRGAVARPIKFYEPKPIDDFESVWRFVWDAYEGYNLWEPNLFEVHFCTVTLPKAGGIIEA